MQAQYDAKAEEADRLHLRLERKYRGVIEEIEAAQRRAKKQIATLEEQLLEAKAGSKVKRTRTTSS
jgi:hypothetical protein